MCAYDGIHGPQAPICTGAPQDAKAAGGCGQPPPSDEGPYVSVLPVPQTRASRHAAVCQPVRTAHTTACGGQDCQACTPLHGCLGLPATHTAPLETSALLNTLLLWRRRCGRRTGVETGLIRFVITLEALLPPFIRHFAAWGTGLLVRGFVASALGETGLSRLGCTHPWHPNTDNAYDCKQQGTHRALPRCCPRRLGGRGVYPLGSCSMLSAHCAQRHQDLLRLRIFLLFPRPRSRS
jgi:hypothetical protein